MLLGYELLEVDQSLHFHGRYWIYVGSPFIGLTGSRDAVVKGNEDNPLTGCPLLIDIRRGV